MDWWIDGSNGGLMNAHHPRGDGAAQGADPMTIAFHQ
jgi:hypothetical protein